MRAYKALVLAAFLILAADFATPPAEAGQEPEGGGGTWARLLGGTSNDTGYLVRQAFDDGFLLGGTTGSFGAGSADPWFVKLALDGSMQWQYTYGSAGNDDGKISVADDGKLLLAAKTPSGGIGEYSFWVVKLDSTGGVVWQKTYGSSGDGFDTLTPASGGGFLISGGAFDGPGGTFAFKLAKVDASGEIIWQKKYSGPDNLSGVPTILDDESIVVSGTKFPLESNNFDLWVMKLDKDGNIQWQKSYGGSAIETAESIVPLAGGGFLLQGETASFGAGSGADGIGDIWILRLDPSGNVLWQKRYGGAGDEAGKLMQASDGGYIFGGWTNSSGAGEGDALVFKINDAGDIAWQKTYGGASLDRPRLSYDSLGGYFLAGETRSFGGGGQDLWALKLDASGNIQWQRAFGGLYDDYGDIKRVIDSTLVLAGGTISFGTNNEMWVWRLNASGQIEGSCPFIADTSIQPGNPSLAGIQTTGTAANTSAGASLGPILAEDANIQKIATSAQLRDTCTMSPPLTASASASVTTGMPPLTVNFTGAGYNGQPPYTFEWNFGDSTMHSAQQNPSHIYSAVGTYHVSLTVTDGASATATDAHLTITVTAAPCSITCDATAPSEGVAGISVSFSASAVPTDCAGTLAFFWDFGDGSQSVTQNPTHTYAIAGTYTWSVTAAIGGKTCVKGGSITIAEPPCTLECTATAPANGLTGAGVAFSATAAPSNCEGGVTFAWTFGDGGTSSDQNPDHTYTTAGTYTWGMTATIQGVTCTKGGSITITDAPVCTLECAAAGPTSGIAGAALSFTSTATPSNCTGSVSFGWTFGDGGTSTDQNPAHTYATAGTYTWGMTATIQGVTCTKGGSITITNAPVCTLECTATGPASGTSGQALSFTSTATPSNCTGSVSFGWTFGDGGTSADQNPAHTYATAGTYTWGMTATIQGVTCTKGGSITITDAPVCTIECTATGPTNGIAGAALSFTSTATPSNCTGSVSFGWTFGDGGTSADQNPAHTYATAGTYTWGMTATIHGVTCTKGGSIAIADAPPCTLECSATVPAWGLTGSQIAFASTATPANCTGAVTFLWSFGDGASSAEQSPSHNYAAAGTYAWSMTATADETTCSKSGTIDIDDTPPCTVTCATVVPTAAKPDTVIPFSATASGTNCTGEIGFLWNFGDGATSTAQEASHSYTSAGSYSWSMLATIQGVNCAKSGTIVISEGCVVTCDATATPGTGSAPLTVQFDSTVTTTNCPGAVTYLWAFGDGSSAASGDASHTYSVAGMYSWSFTARASGATCSKSGTVVVTICAPTCTASATPSGGDAPLSVSFAANATTEGCHQEPAYRWEFGDGSVSDDQNPTHSYLSKGLYTWTATVTADGKSCVQQGTISVTEPICTVTCAASAEPVSGTAPLSVAFTATASQAGCAGSPVYAWSFGDGAISQEQNPTHIYERAGTYNWSLAILVDGAVCTRSSDITVTPECLLDCQASANPASGKAPLDVAFTGVVNSSDCQGDFVFTWNFGDGQTSSNQNPHHTYRTAGSFAWTLSIEVGGKTCTQSGTILVSGGLPGDCDGDGSVSIGEVQKAINMFLGILPPGCGVDCNADGQVSIGELQKVINAFLGLASSC